MELRKTGNRIKTWRELLAGASEKPPGRVEKSMIFEANLLQLKDHYTVEQMTE